MQKGKKYFNMLNSFIIFQMYIVLIEFLQQLSHLKKKIKIKIDKTLLKINNISREIE